MPDEGVFKTEIDQEPVVTRARANSDGDADPGNDLKSALEVIGPTHAWIQIRRSITLGMVRADDGL